MCPPISGTVFLIGAGPGDPDLLTLKGVRLLRAADVVLYDATISSAVLDQCRAGAARLDVGKHKGHSAATQEEIISILIEQARRGMKVARLKAGDPFVFGRGGEEARALRRAGIPFEVVPGVSCVAAVPAYAGIPITDRELGASFGVYSAHRRGGLSYSEEEWRRIARGPDTLVFLMGKTRSDLVVRKLLELGRPASTPVALIFDGTTPRQRTIVGTLGSLAAQPAPHDVPGRCLIVVGTVVNARQEMAWFETEAGAMLDGEG